MPHPVALAKAVAEALSRGAVLPLVTLCRLELRLLPEAQRDKAFQAYSQALAMLPGRLGDQLRRAFYRAVFERVDPSALIEWGTVFTKRDAVIGRGVYVGARCMLGRVTLEDHVTVASNVDILSGKHQHGSDDPAVPIQDQPGRFDRVTLGTNAWVGNGAVILADVGPRSVVAAGSVVVNPVPADVTVAGNPARVVRRRDPESKGWVKA
ncbi:MAG: hypothetical protein JNK72_20840 [Myxococcales bacterium]|nr:hypothetical protein [Myxococcales bacterium]